MCLLYGLIVSNVAPSAGDQMRFEIVREAIERLAQNKT
jgi:hypothetical protein